MAELIAIGSMIGAAIASAGSAAASAAAGLGLGTVAAVGTGAAATTAGTGLAGALGAGAAFVGSHAALIGGGLLTAGALTAGGLSYANMRSSYQNQARTQAASGELQIQAERTQAAIEAEQRQRQLQQILASQNAYFGGSNLAMNSGSFNAIAQDSLATATRQQTQATTFSGVRQSLLGVQVNDALTQTNNAFRSSTLNLALGTAKSLIGGGMQLAQIGSIPATAPAPVLNGSASGPGFSRNIASWTARNA